jgi:hypothetical protein
MADFALKMGAMPPTVRAMAHTSKDLECIAMLLDYSVNSIILDNLLPVACDLEEPEPTLEMVRPLV